MDVLNSSNCNWIGGSGSDVDGAGQCGNVSESSWPGGYYFLSDSLQSIAENGTGATMELLTAAAGNETAADHTYETFLTESRFWVQRVLVPIIMMIGVVGNTITIVIMTRRRMRSSTNNYLAALATFDMLYLIFIFVLSFAQYPNITDEKYYYYWKVFPISIMITDACSNSSVWLTVTFTIERFIVVQHPIKGKLICTESRSRKVVLIVVLFCCAYTLPTPFEWEIRKALDPKSNLTQVILDVSEFGKNEVYKKVYYWLTAALFVFVPLLLLAIFNSFLIRSVHISRKERNDMTQSKQIQASPYSTNGGGGGASTSAPALGTSKSTSTANKFDPNSSKQENKITIMLIAVVILFLCCQLPTAIMLVVTSLHEFERNTKWYNFTRGLNNIFNFLMAINAACNFLLYCLFSQRYRKTFVNVFCPCLKDKLGHLQSTYHQNTLYYSKKAGAGNQSGKDRSNRSPQTDTMIVTIEGQDGHDMKVFSTSTDSTPRRRQSSPASATRRTRVEFHTGPGAAAEQKHLLPVRASIGGGEDIEVVVDLLKKRNSGSSAGGGSGGISSVGGGGAKPSGDQSATKATALIAPTNTINLNSNSNYCDKNANDSPSSSSSTAATAGLRTSTTLTSAATESAKGDVAVRTTTSTNSAAS